jgi:hypothetical protein
MNLTKILPSVPDVARETLLVLAGTVLAAYIISRIPDLQKFVFSNSVTVRDGTGKPLF